MALIAHNVKSAQTLIDINVAWCNWTGMQLRIDKCQSFGMRKIDGSYEQFLPNLSIGDEDISAVKLNESFKYLGKLFNAHMNNAEAKVIVQNKLDSLLVKTTELNLKPQLKLKILKLYISNQLSFDLRINDFSFTWITNSLDALIHRHVARWLDTPISTCVAQFLELPRNQGGYGIPSLKSTAEKLRLGLRLSLKYSTNEDLRNIWFATQKHNISLDSFTNKTDSKTSAYASLKSVQQQKILGHLTTLKIQGSLQKIITDSFSKSTINDWSAFVEQLPETFFRFVRMAVQQQLPTAANLHRWGKSPSPNCSLCNGIQTNKHVLSFCSSDISLSRFKTRHDRILRIIADWLSIKLKNSAELFVDLNDAAVQPLSNVFDSLRPDIAIKSNDSIITLELTICHESNISSSREYKINKYKNLTNHLLPSVSHYSLNRFTIEVTPLGFISDMSNFFKCINVEAWSNEIINLIRQTAISESYKIYCLRNSAI